MHFRFCVGVGLAIDIIHKNRGYCSFLLNAPKIKVIRGLYMLMHDTTVLIKEAGI